MKTKVIIYRQGNSWVWLGTETVQLPYYVQTKKQVRKYIKAKLESYGNYDDIRIIWE